MRKASDFLSKPVVSLKEGKDEGIIKNIGFSSGLKSAEWLLLYDQNDADCEEKALKLSDAHILGEHAVMIKSGQSVMPAVSAPAVDNNPINCRVYTAKGTLLGVVSDVMMTDANAVTGIIYDNDKVLPIGGVLSGSRDVIVTAGEDEDVTAEATDVPERKVPAPRPADVKRKVKVLRPDDETKKPAPVKKKAKKPAPDGIKPVDAGKIVLTAALPELGVAVPIAKVSQHPPVTEQPAPEQPVTIQAVSETVSEEPAPEQPSVEQPSVEPQPLLVYDTGGNIEIWPLELDHIPERIIASYGFLLGRRVGKNICNSAREIVIKADTVVSPNTVETARKYGRLVDLTKLSN